ncbi:MAG: hypothetical protein E7624_05585 [Ruminococcaceae bacterium]|nr:hypothetical protein [Oscillospiraceae bacterium]
MKKRYSLYAWFLLLCLCLGSCYKAPISTPPHTFENLITTQDVQYFSWRTFISNETYVFSAAEMRTRIKNPGVMKYNVASGSLIEVCLQPNCSHNTFLYLPENNSYCHIPYDSKLFFVYENKIFLQYTLEARTEEGQAQHIDTFAYYNFVTGEYKDLLKIQPNDYEQMYYTFLLDGEDIYYSRYVAQTEKPESSKDYALSLCRITIGEYKEEVLFDLSAACGSDPNQLWIPFGADESYLYLFEQDMGHVVAIKRDGTDCRYLADGSDGIISSRDNIYYHNGFIYITSPVSKLDPSVSNPSAHFLYRIDCSSGEKQRLSEDYVSVFFVCDQYVYYQMTPGIQPTAAQLEEAGNQDYSLHTFKQIAHDGANPSKFQFTAKHSQVTSSFWGAGEILFFKMGYREEYPDGSGALLSGYTLLFNLRDHSTTIIGESDDLDLGIEQ